MRQEKLGHLPGSTGKHRAVHFVVHPVRLLRTRLRIGHAPLLVSVPSLALVAPLRYPSHGVGRDHLTRYFLNSGISGLPQETQ